jgi:hypothetical protein
MTNLTLRGMRDFVSSKIGWTKNLPWSICAGMTTLWPEEMGGPRGVSTTLLINLRDSSGVTNPFRDIDAFNFWRGKFS